ncbi:MAG: tetratricopeptide repeat protein [Deltaproteobacteria bacterium]|nr:tetratricopeptide repeat protein [Deltaproteobacteria bacterium]
MSEFDEHELTDAERMEEDSLAELGERFLAALALLEEGKLDQAEDALRDILREEPRLPEPHMELARLLLDTGRLSEAEGEAREALGYLKEGGQWVEDIEENEVLALCHALLAEVLRRRADEDDVLFGDPETFRALVREAKEHFEEAARLDPKDEYSSYHAFFMGTDVPVPSDDGE